MVRLMVCFSFSILYYISADKNRLMDNQGRGCKLILQWRHNEHDSLSNHQPRDCLPNHLFRRRAKKTSMLRSTGRCAGNSPVTCDFPTQKSSYAENVSIWWRHHYTEICMSVRVYTSIVTNVVMQQHIHWMKRDCLDWRDCQNTRKLSGRRKQK